MHVFFPSSHDRHSQQESSELPTRGTLIATLCVLASLKIRPVVTLGEGEGLADEDVYDFD